MSNNNINYFFAFGSMIAAVRHGFRMPWDDDIDIIIDNNDISKLFNGLKLIKLS